MRCPDEHTLQQFLDGTMTGPTMFGVEAHLGSCSECRSVVALAVDGSNDPGPARSGVCDDADDTVALAPGSLVDKYRVIRPLGRGGMGAVYLARDIQLGRRVALKLVLPGAVRSTREAARILREARTTARFNHPNIIAIYDVGEHHGHPYLALEYLAGQTLRARLRQGSLGPPAALRIALAITDALVEAHGGGVVHGDLKPENVFLPLDGRVRVLDFGLAVAAAAADHVNEPVEIGSEDHGVIGSQRRGGGTPAYLAPERQRGAPASRATDVWSFGRILSELAERSAGPLGANLRSIIEACTAAEPAERPPATAVRQRLAVAETAARRGDARPPFRGFNAFSEDDAGLFFARDAEIAHLVEVLEREPAVIVTGASGVGKSSLVRAGLVPRLKESGSWTAITVRPGPHPLRALCDRILSVADHSAHGAELLERWGVGEPEQRSAQRAELEARLAGHPGQLNVLLHAVAEVLDTRVLLLIDPLEELVTVAGSPAEATPFVAALAAAADEIAEPVRVVCNVREDFLSQIASLARDANLLAHVIVLGHPTRSGLRDALMRPVEAVGYRYDDPAMVDDMIDAVEGEPARLPTLQFVAQRLWDRADHDERLVRRCDYDAIGGVTGALVQHADGLLVTWPEPDVELARELLLRLITPDHTRRVVAQPTLLEGLGASAEQILRALIEARLVSASSEPARPDCPMVELSHESLMRAWPRLARWLAHARGDSALAQHVEQAARLWDRRGRQPEELWRGATLREVEVSVGHHAELLPRRVGEFLAEARRREDRRARRRRVAIGAAIGVVAAVVVGSSWMSLRLARETRLAEANEAEAGRQAARAAATRGDLLEARARLRGSLETRDSIVGRGVWRAVASDPLHWKRTLVGAATALDFSPKGGVLATVGGSSTILLWDVQTAEPRRLLGHRGDVSSVRYLPDGLRLVSLDFAGELRLWDVATGTSELLGLHVPAMMGQLAVHPDGQLAATPGRDGAIRIWDLEQRRAIESLVGDAGPLHTVAFSPDGKWLASGGEDGEVRVWDLASRQIVHRLSGARKGTWSVTFASGDELIVGDLNGELSFRAVRTGTKLTGLPEVADWITDVAVHRESRTMVTNGMHPRVVDLATRQPRFSLPIKGAWEVALSHDAQLIAATTSSPPTLWLLRNTPPPPTAVEPHRVALLRARVSPDRRWLMTADETASHRLWDLAAGTVVRAIEGVSPGGVAFSPDGVHVALGLERGELELREVATWKRTRRLQGHDPGIIFAQFRRGGAQLVTGTQDGEVRVWDVASGAVVTELKTRTLQRGVAGAMVLTADERRLAVTGMGEHVRLWDLDSAVMLRELDTPYVTHLAIDASGSLAPHGWGGAEIIDPRTGGRRSLDVRNALSFHPDGRRMVAVGVDGVAWIRRAEDPELAGDAVPLRGHQGDVRAVSLSTNGELIVTGGHDGTVRTWWTDSGRPMWNAAAVLSAPPQMFSHRGWTRLDDSAATLAPEASRWRQAIRQRGRRSSVSETTACVVTFDGSVEVWDVRADSRAKVASVEGLIDVSASPVGCVIGTGRGVELVTPRGVESRLAEGPVTALGHRGVAPVAVIEDRLRAFSPSTTNERPVIEVGPGATAVAASEHEIAVGYRDGRVRVRPSRARAWVELHDVPLSAVTRLAIAAPGVVAAGFRDGTVGLWAEQDGFNLQRSRLHGPVIDLLVAKDTLHAVSELGDHVAWDVSAFVTDYCTLLRQTWARTPVVWRLGRAFEQPRPGDHPCARP